MNKKVFLVLPLLITVLAGCDSNKEDNSLNLSFDEGSNITETTKKGELGDFSLVAPAKDAIVNSEPTFSWTASSNAISYTLEVCSSESFISNTSSIVYAKETNISTTSFKLSADLKTKDITYYWRVTAVNDYNSKTVGKTKVSEVSSFFYEVLEAGEISIPIGEEEDWSLHKEGSFATVKIDNTDFFGTGNQDSLRISFDKEDTKQGNIKSDGWIVVQRPIEMDFYGTDALYFNFYYSGNDSNIFIRLIDADGEYWFKQIKVSQNARQTVFMKFSEFELRTRDTVVQNEVFNYEHLQFFEVCFEQTFGDGCCVIGGIKAVNYSNYKDLFIEKLDFRTVPTDKWISEAYNFGKQISEDGSELTLLYSTTAGEYGNEKGINNQGYGFAKIPVECYFATSNAIRLKIKYTGYKSNVSGVLRIYEEDTDRWSYEQPFSTLVEGEYKELTIPFNAFAKSEIRGDGHRQFAYILQMQFGLRNVYGGGSISFKDVELIEIPAVSENKKVVGEDGIIEDFDSYTDRTQIYESWEMSSDNKDESVALSTSEMFHNGVNVNCGQFAYKTDMSLAYYDVYTDVNVTGLNAIKFWVKDRSNKSSDPRFEYLNSEDVASKMTIQIALKDGRWYRYVIEKAPKRWTEYTLKFTDFTLEQGVETSTSTPITSEYVVNFAFGFQYFYYLENGMPFPTYIESNPVYMDSIRFANANETRSEELEKVLHPDQNKTTLVDNFEYEDQDSLANHWLGLNKLDYEKVTLSDDVSSEGGSHSMKLDYKGYSSPSYAHYPAVGSDVESRSIIVDIKGDGKATIYLNLYVNVGSSLKQYRYTIMTAESGWNRYVIGLGTSNFVPIDDPKAPSIGKTTMQNLQRLTFGIVNNSSQEVSSIYIDNLKFDYANGYTSNSVTPII